MDFQWERTDLIAKQETLRELLSKSFAQWTQEEISLYGNHEIASAEKELVIVSLQLLDIELLFEKDFSEWSPVEKKTYGQLEESAWEQVRNEWLRLREKRTLHLRAKEVAEQNGTCNPSPPPYHSRHISGLHLS